ncbi:MAG TPA: tRNA epoxyqueuosine(34) reductase QueG, partial [Nordella sp.]|nr:tRNA epoxyqueuosine(34) reductase QueG [Nordella sp.]
MTPLEDRLRRKAREEGFAALRIADPAGAAPAGQRLQEFLGFGREGDMEWLKETAARRADPRVLWPEARSAILL